MDEGVIIRTVHTSHDLGHHAVNSIRFRLGVLPRAALLLAVTTSIGCVSPWWNALLDPSQVGNFHDNVVNEIQQTISFRDSPSGIAGASEPTPEDLVQTVKEYEIGVGDVLSIRMLDFLLRDVESEFTPTVDELGYITITQLGDIHVEGMTARELKAELIQRAINAGIFNKEREPNVVVSFLQQQQRMYNISGAVPSPGRYRIIPPDFRLREAINQAGGLDPSVKVIYVFRNEPKPKRIIDRGVRPRSTEPPSSDEPAPPVAPESLSEQAAGPNPPPAPAESNLQPATRNAQPSQVGEPRNAERELIEAIAPSGSETPRAAEQPAVETPAAPPPQPATSQALPPFIFVNDRFIESPAPATRQAVPPAQPEAPAVTPPQAPEETVDWEDLTSDGQTRIIRIPAEKLANGEPNYNIVIKHDDWIRLDAGLNGVFYVMGHVVRPGVYSLTGQEITLRQAIAAAGGLDALAWPTRCEIVRRIDGDREEITQWDLARIIDGQDPDLFLKPEDVINVGTHAVAPLLATIRNAFRLTYGFGFVYDRNFADIDSYTPIQNPNDRRRSEFNQRFPGLFP